MCYKAGTQLTVPVNPSVIFNFKVHLAEMCKKTIRAWMSMELAEFGLREKYAGEMIKQGIKARAINSTLCALCII